MPYVGLYAERCLAQGIATRKSLFRWRTEILTRHFQVLADASRFPSFPHSLPCFSSCFQPLPFLEMGMSPCGISSSLPRYMPDSLTSRIESTLPHPVDFRHMNYYCFSCPHFCNDVNQSFLRNSSNRLVFAGNRRSYSVLTILSHISSLHLEATASFTSCALY